MAKYVKLGGKAMVFFDPTTGLKVLPGEVKKLDNKTKFSKKVNAALRGGHLEVASEEDFLNGLPENTTEEAGTENWVETYQDFSEESLIALKKDKLVELAQFHGSEYSLKDLQGLKKDELVEEILELTAEEE